MYEMDRWMALAWHPMRHLCTPGPSLETEMVIAPDNPGRKVIWLDNLMLTHRCFRPTQAALWFESCWPIGPYRGRCTKPTGLVRVIRQNSLNSFICKRYLWAFNILQKQWNYAFRIEPATFSLHARYDDLCAVEWKKLNKTFIQIVL